MPAASIQILLVDGTADGLKVVKKGNWNGVAVVAARATWPSVKSRGEFNGPGVYVLVGPPEDSPEGSIYVGEADVLRTRIDQHYASKDFWVRLIAFASKDESLNKANARYLEAKLVSLAKAAKRTKLENSNLPSPAGLSEFERADADNFLREMLLIYPLMGVNAFEVVHTTSSAALTLYVKTARKVASASGLDAPEGFVVYGGAHVEPVEAPVCPPHVRVLRSQLLEAGALVVEGDHLLLTQDYVFPSPSAAAALVLGRNANGRTEWKDATGRTLKELQEQESTV